MDSTADFKKIIQNKLTEMADNDGLFAINYKKENKNIDDCIKYILNTVKRSGKCGFADDEIFGMAAHYYDEDGIEVGGEIKCKIAVNRPVELSEEDKRLAKEKAMEMEIAEQRKKLHKKKSPKTKKPATVTEQTLF